MNYKIVSIDLAKNVFQICALDEHCKVKVNKKASRDKLLDTLRQLEPTLVVRIFCGYFVGECCNGQTAVIAFATGVDAERP